LSGPACLQVAAGRIRTETRAQRVDVEVVGRLVERREIAALIPAPYAHPIR
jgi:hypothetical protein